MERSAHEVAVVVEPRVATKTGSRKWWVEARRLAQFVRNPTTKMQSKPMVIMTQENQ